MSKANKHKNANMACCHYCSSILPHCRTYELKHREHKRTDERRIYRVSVPDTYTGFVSILIRHYYLFKPACKNQQKANNNNNKTNKQSST